MLLTELRDETGSSVNATSIFCEFSSGGTIGVFNNSVNVSTKALNVFFDILPTLSFSEDGGSRQKEGCGALVPN